MIWLGVAGVLLIAAAWVAAMAAVERDNDRMWREFNRERLERRSER